VAKGEWQATDEIWQALKSTKGSVYSRLLKLGFQLTKKRELGAIEAADLVLGHRYYRSSVAVEWLGVGLPAERRRKIKLGRELKQMDPSQRDYYEFNWIDDYYPGRPERLADMCLYDFFSNFNFVKKQPLNLEQKTADGTAFRVVKYISTPVCIEEKTIGYVVKRGTSKVVRTANVGTRDAKCRERYFCSILQLFLPWKKEDELLSDGNGGSFDTYAAAYDHHLAAGRLEKASEFEEGKRKMREAFELAKQLEKEAQAEQEADDADLLDASDAMGAGACHVYTVLFF